jgi:uncharacterized phage-associated protein
MIAKSIAIGKNSGYPMSKPKAIDIADWFVNRANLEKEENFGEGISNMKLQKILYFAQAAHITVENSPLFSEEIYAWKYGPVVDEVYHAYKGNQSTPIERPLSNKFEKLDSSTTSFLEEVWQLFGKYTAAKLVEMSHAHAPWKSVYDGSRNKLISKNSIQKYYKNVFVRPEAA